MAAKAAGVVAGSLDAVAVRLSVIGIVVASLFLALFARLLFLQVVESPRLAAAAQANTVRTVYEEAPRGRILDRDGALIAGNREVDVVTVDRAAVEQDGALLARLAAFLGTEEATLRQRFTDTKASPYRPVPVARSVDKALIASLRERAGEFPGVSAETQVERWYPHGTLAAHVLGYVGEINDRELAERQSEAYRLGDEIGKSGIEQSFERELRGRPGVDRIEVDSSGRPVRVLESTPPEPGRDLQLSIDLEVQKAAEEALVQGLAMARTIPSQGAEPGGMRAPGGSVVALDPRNGAVLAMASFPTFDPRAFTDGIGQAEYAELTKPDSALPLTNRAVQGQYAPGSTFKLVTALAALDANLINGRTTIVDGGAFVLGNRRYQNAQGRAYGRVDVADALAVSSDVFFYNLGARFWESRNTLGHPIQETAREFALGRTQGIALAGEAPGRVPDPESRRRLHAERPDAYPEGNWYGGDNVNLAIGQGDTLVTPLQLANLYASFANGGTVYTPTVVAQVLDSAGEPLTETRPQVVAKADVPQAISDPVRSGLERAVSDRRGTAFSAFNGFDLRAFPVAGKTGTAQVTGKDDYAVFAGYGPANDPQVAVSVVLEEAGFGGVTAAPVGRRVLAAVAGQPVTPIALGTGVD